MLALNEWAAAEGFNDLGQPAGSSARDEQTGCVLYGVRDLQAHTSKCISGLSDERIDVLRPVTLSHMFACRLAACLVLALSLLKESALEFAGGHIFMNEAGGSENIQGGLH